MVDPYTFIRDLSGIIARTTDPGDVLKGVVNLIATRLRFDGCVLTLWGDGQCTPAREVWGGAWTRTLSPRGLPFYRSLTATVREQKAPVILPDTPCPALPPWGEEQGERLATAVGVPLWLDRASIGVLVLLAGRTRFRETDLPALTEITNHAVAALHYAGTLRQLGVDPAGGLQSPGSGAAVGTGPAERRPLLAGTPVSPGLAGGRARLLGSHPPPSLIADGQSAHPVTELERFRRAVLLTREEILTLMERARLFGLEDASILETFLVMLDDHAFWDQISALLHEGQCAESALVRLLEDYLGAIRSAAEPVLQHRLMDLEDLGNRLLRNLRSEREKSPVNPEEDFVLVAREISALDLLGLRHDRLKAVLLAGGALGSHSSILARSFEIPMLIGVGNLLATVHDGDPLIVDADSGLVFCRPSSPLLAAYERLESRNVRRVEVLDSLRALRAETRDGHRVRLGANIGLPSDLDTVTRYGADHVGLYRTEMTFLVRPRLPSEEEQLSLYRQVLAAAAHRPVVFRTLDLGGDKLLPALDAPREDNPQLGWRSIRVTLELEEVFRTQIRAILRASAFGRAAILLPMVTSVEEMTRSAALVAEEKARLSSRGIPYDSGVKLGLMVEVPGTVKILPLLLRYADFASIGTNDLVQYTLAVDRGNLKVASLYNPLHPAVIATIYEAVGACRQAGKEVTICGESAAQPTSAFLYLAMQADCLSMNPAAIPLVKMVIRQSALVCARVVLERVLEMETAAEIQAYVDTVLPALPVDEPLAFSN